MEAAKIPDPELARVSAYLTEQVELCHTLTRSMFDTFCNEPRVAQNDTLKSITRLIQVTATAATALNRVKGTEIHQIITIQRAGKNEGKGAGKNEGQGAPPDCVNGTMPLTHRVQGIDLAAEWSRS